VSQHCKAHNQLLYKKNFYLRGYYSLNPVLSTLLGLTAEHSVTFYTSKDLSNDVDDDKDNEMQL